MNDIRDWKDFWDVKNISTLCKHDGCEGLLGNERFLQIMEDTRVMKDFLGMKYLSDHK